ncbi:protein PHTF2-like [Rhopilema esculentum]|uniref:protein PHTF2-like n=1 Tax=Rhopilema esculentum TaxID=499914 RepID=UPI0031DC301D
MDYDHTISWFQTKIGTYDKANWERIVEKHEISLLPDLQKIQHLRSVRVRTDLIDVDLVRGSTFSKAKPGYHWTQVTRKAILRVLLFPIYWQWWQQQTSFILWLFFVMLYFSQLISLSFYLSDRTDDMKDIPFTEAISPVIIMILLGEVYIHVVSTNFTKPSNHLVKKKRKVRKRSNGRKKRKGSKEENAQNVPQQQENHATKTVETVRQRKVQDSVKEEQPEEAKCQEDAEERQDKPSSGRDSSTGDTSSGSDSSSDSSTSSISDSENGNDLNDENPFHTAPSTAVNKGQNSHFDLRPSPVEETVMVSVWDGNSFKKVKMTLLEISSTIVQKVDSHQVTNDYFPVGILSAVFLSLLPMFFRIYKKGLPDIPDTLNGASSFSHQLFIAMCGSHSRSQLVVLINMVSRFSLSFSFFFLLCVAERAYRMRYLYAKYFGALTSARKARRNCLPHFRLHKVRHIKTWLSLRSFLKKRGPQRSVDTIMSSSFLLGLVFVVITCIQFIKYNGISDKDSFISYYFNWEVTAWTMIIGIYLIRFLTLGAEINLKYRNNTVLLTEQINLYLQMEYTPQKKEELSIANNVLKLASKLLKELESPFKISGFIMSPLLSNIIRVVVLSLFSGVMSDILGFRLKLWKIKAE